MTGDSRQPALDALRGAAVLLVVAAHVGVPGMAWAGQIGVAVFFTLSGFLITRILLRGQPRRVFYARRVVRLAPALVVVLAVELAVTREPIHVTAAAAYVSNWWAVAGLPPSPISHTWSLAVEEQFYLLWPVLLVIIGRRHRLAAAVILIAAWRVVAWQLGWEAEVQWGTLSNALGLCAGAWIAVAQPRPRPWMMPTGIAALAAVTITAAGAAAATGFLLAIPAAIAATALIITDHQHAAPRLLCWFGTISYGWYLWHQWFINTWGHDAGMIERGFLAACALAAAAASFYLLEKPISASYVRRHATAKRSSQRSTATSCSPDAPAAATSPTSH